MITSAFLPLARPAASASSTKTSASIFSTSEISATLMLRQTVSPTRMVSPIQPRLRVKTPSCGRADLQRAPAPSRERRMASSALRASTSMRPSLLRASLRSTRSLASRVLDLGRLQRSSISLSMIWSREKISAVAAGEGAGSSTARGGRLGGALRGRGSAVSQQQRLLVLLGRRPPCDRTRRWPGGSFSSRSSKRATGVALLDHAAVGGQPGDAQGPLHVARARSPAWPAPGARSRPPRSPGRTSAA